jgi:hypothetical protein
VAASLQLHATEVLFDGLVENIRITYKAVGVDHAPQRNQENLNSLAFPCNQYSNNRTDIAKWISNKRYKANVKH